MHDVKLPGLVEDRLNTRQQMNSTLESESQDYRMEASKETSRWKLASRANSSKL